jgi:hypothetical protein
MALSPGIQRQGREANHSPPSSAEVKNAWSYTSTPQYPFMASCLVKHRNNFIFTLKISGHLYKSQSFSLFLIRLHSEDLGIDGRIILERILRNWGEGVDRMCVAEPVAGPCEQGNEPSSSI